MPIRFTGADVFCLGMAAFALASFLKWPEHEAQVFNAVIYSLCVSVVAFRKRSPETAQD